MKCEREDEMVRHLSHGFGVKYKSSRLSLEAGALFKRQTLKSTTKNEAQAGVTCYITVYKSNFSFLLCISFHIYRTDHIKDNYTELKEYS